MLSIFNFFILHNCTSFYISFIFNFFRIKMICLKNTLSFTSFVKDCEIMSMKAHKKYNIYLCIYLCDLQIYICNTIDLFLIFSSFKNHSFSLKSLISLFDIFTVSANI